MASADRIIVGARIFTADREAPWASAMAIAGGNVLAIGSDAHIARFRGEGTEVDRRAGAFIAPGFVDAHNHHAHAGRAELYQLSISPDASFAEVISQVRTYAEDKGPNEWIVGSGWGSGLLGELSGTGARSALDAAARGRPVILTDDSHHNRFANSAALERAGVAAATTDPDGGRIVRSADGVPTGLMLETASLLIETAMSKERGLSPEQHRNATARAVKICHTYGITSFQDAAVSIEQMSALKELDDAGALHARVVSSMTVNDPIFGYRVVGNALIARGEEFRTARHRPDFVKIFLDGTPPGLSGAFVEPYLPNEHGDGHCGNTTMDARTLRDWLERTASEGISAKIHCTGDAAVRQSIDAIEQVRSKGYWGVRYQIAHGQFIQAEDIPRLAELRITIEFSPFLFFPGVIADALRTVRPAPEMERVSPIRSLIDSGVLVAGGTDWPVSPTPNVWEGVHGLVTRADPHGVRLGALAASEAISVSEALGAFTVNAAQAVGIGDIAGSLEPGKSADFAIHSQNPFEIDPHLLGHTVVDETWFAGRRMFSRDREDSSVSTR